MLFYINTKLLVEMYLLHLAFVYFIAVGCMRKCDCCLFRTPMYKLADRFSFVFMRSLIVKLTMSAKHNHFGCMSKQCWVFNVEEHSGNSSVIVGISSISVLIIGYTEAVRSLAKTLCSARLLKRQRIKYRQNFWEQFNENHIQVHHFIFNSHPAWDKLNLGWIL